MSASSAIRFQVESALAHRIPYALTPAPRTLRETLATGIEAVDDVLQGGLLVGAISELVGPECSGRTSLALSIVATVMSTEKVAAWIDVSGTLDPVSAAGAGVDLARLLWVRCGSHGQSSRGARQHFSLPQQYLLPKTAKKGLHGGSHGSHPRTEVKGLSAAVTELLHPEPRSIEPQKRASVRREAFKQACALTSAHPASKSSPSPWTCLDEALRSTDQLLQSGGFSIIVLDMGSLAPEVTLRVPLATWFRYRAAADRTRATIVLLTQHPCAKSSSALVLEMHPAQLSDEERTVLAGAIYKAEVGRRRFSEEPRKPIRRVSAAQWFARAPRAGQR